MIVLGAALFSVPAVVVLDDAGSTEAIALTAIVGVTAALVAWRIAKLVAETDRAREVLAESEARFRAFVQHSSDVVGVDRRAGGITYVSPSVQEVFGYRAERRCSGRPILDLIHPDDLDRASRRHRLARRSPVRERDGRAALPPRRRLVALGRDDVHEPDARARGPRHRRQLPRRHRAPADRGPRRPGDAGARADPRAAPHPRDAARADGGGRGLPRRRLGDDPPLRPRDRGAAPRRGADACRLHSSRRSTAAGRAGRATPRTRTTRASSRSSSPTSKTTRGTRRWASSVSSRARTASARSGRCRSARPTTSASSACWRSTCATRASRPKPSSR